MAILVEQDVKQSVADSFREQQIRPATLYKRKKDVAIRQEEEKWRGFVWSG
ncbi:MAG: hypothetical protein KBG02_04995 [Haliscomenobacter sp.]|nr:hypothetical protein [Haliscomenobacter sp.]MBK8656878.1 hypothetical protein [Haliscomenobacter sp.]MBP9076195.1 hypothetical protein [Haliscomenobacter sp.]